MKKLKRMAGLMLALVMAFAMSLTSFAANVTVPDGLSGHTFVGYQIFTGTQKESEGALGDVKWGNGINSDAFLAALKGDAVVGAVFTDCTTAADTAKQLGTISTNSDAAKAVAKLALANKAGDGIPLTAGEKLATGYYLIVDTTTVANQDMASNAALLQVTGTITIAVKTDKPSVEKKVFENNQYTTDGGYGAGYNDVADYHMGDAVPFRLIGTVPDMTYYDTYKYIFHDTMSNGLTLNAGTVKVYVADDKAGTGKKEIAASAYTATTGDHALTVSFADLKTVADVETGNYILVEYTATLNQEAVVGLDGNPNVVYLEYSNAPDRSGEGVGDNTGKTPEDRVIVFTYELDTTKVDGTTEDPLPRAQFKLHNAANQWVIVNGDNKVTGWSNTEEGGSTLTSGNDGLFRVIGLDDGTYHLKETQAPDGYNILTGEIEVVIQATTANGQSWTNGVASSALTGLTVTADGVSGTANMGTGIVGIQVANNTGATLPETGGMGTTLFRVVGTVLVLCAAIALVVRRRMKNS